MAATGEAAFESLVEHLGEARGSTSGQMFGKRCIKINGKAGIALFADCVVFKLPKPVHGEAMALAGSVLWDPSGKGRSMKEWVQVGVDHEAMFRRFAEAAADYVG